MILLSAGTGVAAWFVFMTLLRRLVAQPELINKAKGWAGVSVVLISSLFTLALVFALAAVDRRFLGVDAFLVVFSVFLLLSIVTSIQLSRKALP